MGTNNKDKGCIREDIKVYTTIIGSQEGKVVPGLLSTKKAYTLVVADRYLIASGQLDVTLTSS